MPRRFLVRRPAPTKRTVGSLIPVLLGLSVLACTDLAHTNPYDPLTPVQIEIVGPDSTHSYRQEVTYAARFTPAWPDAPMVWTSSSRFLQSFGDGRFLVGDRSATPRAVTITVTAGPHTQTRTVFVRQKPARVRMACGDTITAIDDTAPVCHALYDSAGFVLDVNAATAQAMVPASYEVRDQSVLALETGTTGPVVRARSPGSSLVVAHTALGSDSVAYLVRQVATDFSVAPACPWTVAVGDSMQIQVRDVVDRNTYPIASFSPFFLIALGGESYMRVTRDGWLHGIRLSFPLFVGAQVDQQLRGCNATVR
jgi:hypothetical protein